MKENCSGFVAILTLTLVFFTSLVNGNLDNDKYNEENGKAYLKKINEEIQIKTTESVLASWGYESNITDENLANQVIKFFFFFTLK